MKKRALCLLLALFLVMALFAGCGTTQAEPAEPEVEENPPTATEPAEAAPLPETEPELEPEPEPVADCPLCEEEETLSIFMMWNANLTNYMPDYFDDNPSMIEAQELTNVKLEYTYVTTDTGPTQFGILAAAEDLPDLVHRALTWYGGTRDEAVEEGVFVDLTEHFAADGLLANYYNSLEKLGLTEAALGKSENGRIVTVDKVNDEPVPNAITGFAARADYLDKINWKAEDIVTYDDWYEVLTAMKTELGLASPLLIPFNGATINLTNGMDVSLATSFVAHVPYVVDGKITYGYLEEGFTEYIELMQKWYSEGLIYADFYTDTKYMFTPQESGEVLYGGDCGIWFSSKWVFGSALEEMFAGVDGFDYYPIVQPRRTEDSQGHLMTVYADRLVDGFAVSADSDKAELAIRWLNFWFSETGYKLANYGVEGVTYEVKDGEISYTDLLTANSDGMSFSLAISAFTCECLDMCEYWAQKLDLTYTEKQRMATEVWAEGVDDAWLLPSSLVLSAEAADEYSTLFADIQTCIDEMLVGLIIGELGMDQIPVFQQRLRDLGIDRCIEIYQEAYDNM